MKNQYFGDISDYRKYGLLRVLQGSTDLRLLVAWMLTPDDGGRDGEFRSYLSQPDRWKSFDPELYEKLKSVLLPGSERAVSLIERFGLLPRTTFFSKLVPDQRSARDTWSAELLESAARADLVFLDPDNGIEVRSRPIGSKNSSKYLAWSEIEALWSAKCSLLIYQHFRREKRGAFIRRLVSDLQSLEGASFVQAFRTAHVVFFLVSQEHHESQLRNATQRLSVRWAGEIHLAGCSSDSPSGREQPPSAPAT